MICPHCKDADESLIRMYIYALTGQPVSASSKQEALDSINAVLGTQYGITAFNNWLAGRKPTPVRAQNHMRRLLLVTHVGTTYGNHLADAMEL